MSSPRQQQKQENIFFSSSQFPTLSPQLLQWLGQLFTHNYNLFRMITERTSAVSSSFSTKLTCAQSSATTVEEHVVSEMFLHCF